MREPTVHRPDGILTFPPRLRGEGPLARVSTHCPRCGLSPALRFDASAARALAALPAGTRILTYQCHRPRCREIYDVGVSALRAGTGRTYKPP